MALRTNYDLKTRSIVDNDSKNVRKDTLVMVTTQCQVPWDYDHRNAISKEMAAALANSQLPPANSPVIGGTEKRRLDVSPIGMTRASQITESDMQQWPAS